MKSYQIIEAFIETSDANKQEKQELKFKLKISSSLEGTKIITRTFSQFEWLHNKLQTKHLNLFIPPFPSNNANNGNTNPNPNLGLGEDLYLEKKKQQMDRFVKKIFSRVEFEQDPDTDYFLSDIITPLDKVKKKSFFKEIKSISSLSGISVNKEYHQGFRIFVPEILEGEGGVYDDQEEFITRKSYILTIEANFSKVVESTSKLVKLKQSLSKSLLTMSSVLVQNLTDSTSFVNNLKTFNSLFENIHKLSSKQTSLEIINFGDVILEYSHSIPLLKRLMNERTGRLVEYIDSLKQKSKKYEKVLRVRLKHNSHNGNQSTDILVAEDEEKTAIQKCDEAKEKFNEIKSSVTKEFVRFEKEKSRDLKLAMREYAEMQVKFGTEVIGLCERALSNRKYS